jgi:hypothetical protein
VGANNSDTPTEVVVCAHFSDELRESGRPARGQDAASVVEHGKGVDLDEHLLSR